MNSSSIAIKEHFETFACAFRRQFCKSTTCEISANEQPTDDIDFESSNMVPMNRSRQSGLRRFSLAKIDSVTNDSNESSTTGSFFFSIKNYLPKNFNFQFLVFFSLKMIQKHRDPPIVLTLFKNCFFVNSALKLDHVQSPFQ